MKNWKMILVISLSIINGCGANLDDTALVQNAKDYLEDGEIQAASIQLRNALNQNPENIEARWLLGKLELEYGDAAAAEKELSRAHKLGVDNEAVIPLLALAYAEQDKLEELLALEAPGMTPQAMANVLATQAMVLLSRQQLKDAAKKIEQALSLSPDSVEALTEKARLLRVQGDIEGAKSVLESALEIENGYAPAWSLLGDVESLDQHPEQAEMAYSKAINARARNHSDLSKRARIRIQLKKFKSAQNDVDQIKQQNPDDVEANTIQGLLHLVEQRYEDARASFETALKGNEKYFPARYHLAITYFQMNDLEQSARHAQAIISSKPWFTPARKLMAMIHMRHGEYTEVEKLLRPVLKTQEDDVITLNLLASAYVAQGKAAESIPLLEKVAGLQPDSAVAHMRLGSSLIMLGERELGMKQLDTALELDPDLQQVNVLLIQQYLQLKEVDKALAAVQGYRERNPELARPYNLLGIVYLAMENPISAKKAFEKALEIEPANIIASHNLATLSTANNDNEKARLYYREVLKHHKNHLGTLLKLAELEDREGKKDSMAQILEQAIETNPKELQPRLLLAYYHLEKGSPDKAQSDLGSFLQSSSNNPQVLAILGQVQLANKDWTGAKSTLTKVVELQSDSAEAHYLLARAYLRLDDFANAKIQYEKAIDLNPDHLKARMSLARLLTTRGELDDASPHIAVLKNSMPEDPEVIKLEAAFANASGEYEQALDLSSELIEKRSTSSDVLIVARQHWLMGDREGAVELLESWVEKHQDDVQARMALAKSYITLGRTIDGLNQCRAVLEMEENNLEALSNLAWHLRDSNPGEALKYAEKANSLFPDSIQVADLMAVVLMKNGNIEQALRFSERASSKAADQPNILYHRAVILNKSGQTAEAKKALSMALDNNMPFPERGEAEEMMRQLNGG